MKLEIESLTTKRSDLVNSIEHAKSTISSHKNELNVSRESLTEMTFTLEKSSDLLNQLISDIQVLETKIEELKKKGSILIPKLEKRISNCHMISLQKYNMISICRP